MPTLKATVGKRDRLDQRTRSRIKAAKEGDDLDDAQPVLNFESYTKLSRLLSPKNLELALSEIEDRQQGFWTK